MSTVTRAVVVAVGSLALFAQACTLASPTTIKEVPTDSTDGTDATSADTSASADAPASTAAPAASSCTGGNFTKPDLTTLTACGSGKGHCYGADKVPTAAMFDADTCSSGQVCVPDEILSAGGGKLASCTESLLGVPGACVNLALIPAAEAAGGSALKADGCAAGLICTPCTDPTHNNAPTGLCEAIGVKDTSCAAPATGGGTTTTPPAPAASPGCCTTNGVSNGICIASSAIPSGDTSMVIQDSCAQGNSCVPKALASGTPTTCDGGFLGAGVCIDQCFSQELGFASQVGVLSQDKCGATEVCVPCELAKLQGGSTPIPGCN